jgi:hypothetical protein
MKSHHNMPSDNKTKDGEAKVKIFLRTIWLLIFLSEVWSIYVAHFFYDGNLVINHADIIYIRILFYIAAIYEIFIIRKYRSMIVKNDDNGISNKRSMEIIKHFMISNFLCFSIGTYGLALFIFTYNFTDLHILVGLSIFLILIDYPSQRNIDKFIS